VAFGASFNPYDFLGFFSSLSLDESSESSEESSDESESSFLLFFFFFFFFFSASSETLSFLDLSVVEPDVLALGFTYGS